MVIRRRSGEEGEKDKVVVKVKYRWRRNGTRERDGLIIILVLKPPVVVLSNSGALSDSFKNVLMIVVRHA